MLKEEEEMRQLQENFMKILEKNENVTIPFLKVLSKHVHSKIRVDRALKRLKRKDAKVWEEIQTKGFTQALTSVYTLCIIHVLSATVAAVFGRCHRQQEDSEDSSAAAKWDVSRERKIQCTEFCVRYFQNHGLDKLIEKVEAAVKEEVTLVSEDSDEDVKRELSLEMFEKVHERVRDVFENALHRQKISTNTYRYEDESKIQSKLWTIGYRQIRLRPIYFHLLLLKLNRLRCSESYEMF
jgi:hypothetical protein